MSNTTLSDPVQWMKEEFASAETALREAKNRDDILDAMPDMVEAACKIEILKPLVLRISRYPDRAVNYIKDAVGEWEYILLHNSVTTKSCSCSCNAVTNAIESTGASVLGELYRHVQSMLSVDAVAKTFGS